jgi:ubiquinone biosynthesis protein
MQNKSISGYQTAFFSYFFGLQGRIGLDKSRWPDFRSDIAAKLAQARKDNQLKPIVSRIVATTDIASFLPPAYSKFNVVLREGAVFMMCALSDRRLAAKLFDQLLLPVTATPAHRLFELIKDMPTLQKLGQIICRHPGLDPEFKQSLIALEDNLHTVDYATLSPLLQSELKGADRHTLTMDNQVLAEASVCAVVPAEIATRHAPLENQKVVLKVVKPQIRENMAQELALWDQLGDFLNDRQSRWGLDEFNFRDTIARVRHLIENELDLAAEQANLRQVRHHFKEDHWVRIPEPLPLSTPQMTVMARLNGKKVTDTKGLTRKEKRDLATALFRICILQPVQEIREKSYFHGDPHAGNLAYFFKGRHPQLILYDWSMTGQLTRLERFALVLLTLGLMTSNRMVIFFAMDIISSGQVTQEDALAAKVKQHIEKLTHGSTEPGEGLLSKIEMLFETLVYQGVLFSSDLLMFEKAMVTLKGVLSEIDPDFDRDHALIWVTMTRMINDMLHLRLQKVLLDELWHLYRYNLGKFLGFQKAIAAFLLEIGLSWVPIAIPAMLPAIVHSKPYRP